MKKLFFALLAMFVAGELAAATAVSGTSVQSPESVLTCASVDTHLILSKSLPGNINGGQCKAWIPGQPPDECASCLVSLENQGCRIVEIVSDNVTYGPERYSFGNITTYLLSCVKP